MKKLTKRIGQILTGAASVATLVCGRALAATTPAEGENSPVQEGAEAARGDKMPAELVGPNGTFTQITNTILYIVGIVSVVMLIYGGLRYVTSGGDSKKVTDAKNTILYAIIGLIVAVLSYAIVNFVINAIGGNSDTAK